jgi:hypothetical protein
VDATPLPDAGQFHTGPVQPFQQLEELAGDGSLEAPPGVAGALALAAASDGVGAGRRVVT